MKRTEPFWKLLFPPFLPFSPVTMQIGTCIGRAVVGSKGSPKGAGKVHCTGYRKCHKFHGIYIVLTALTRWSRQRPARSILGWWFGLLALERGLVWFGMAHFSLCLLLGTANFFPCWVCHDLSLSLSTSLARSVSFSTCLCYFLPKAQWHHHSMHLFRHATVCCWKKSRKKKISPNTASK